MEFANIAMKKTLVFYLIILGGIIFIAYLCYVASKRDNSKKESMNIYLIAISALLMIYILTSFVPFLKDYFTNSIVVQRGIYQNIIGDEAKSTSGVLGIYSVTFESENQEISLTTVPLQNEIFIQGKYEVNAYYTSSSKRLLYIEIVNNME